MHIPGFVLGERDDVIVVAAHHVDTEDDSPPTELVVEYVRHADAVSAAARTACVPRHTAHIDHVPLLFAVPIERARDEAGMHTQHDALMYAIAAASGTPLTECVWWARLLAWQPHAFDASDPHVRVGIARTAVTGAARDDESPLDWLTRLCTADPPPCVAPVERLSVLFVYAACAAWDARLLRAYTRATAAYVLPWTPWMRFAYGLAPRGTYRDGRLTTLTSVSLTAVAPNTWVVRCEGVDHASCLGGEGVACESTSLETVLDAIAAHTRGGIGAATILAYPPRGAALEPRAVVLPLDVAIPITPLTTVAWNVARTLVHVASVLHAPTTEAFGPARCNLQRLVDLHAARSRVLPPRAPRRGGDREDGLAIPFATGATERESSTTNARDVDLPIAREVRRLYEDVVAAGEPATSLDTSHVLQMSFVGDVYATLHRELQGVVQVARAAGGACVSVTERLAATLTRSDDTADADPRADQARDVGDRRGTPE